MASHFQLSDQEFAQQFEQCTLPPNWFSHEAHLRLAWIMIQRWGVEEAARQMCRQISKFDQVHGDGTKFNTTVTVAAVKVVHHFMEAGTVPKFSSAFNRVSPVKRQLYGTHPHSLRF